MALHEEIVCAGANPYMHYTCGSNSLYLEGFKNTCMSLNVSKVWMLTGEQEILVDASTIKENDKIVIHMGNVIPFDGTV